MLDPTIAEQLARLTKEIADNVNKVERGTANSVHRAIALQSIFNDLIGSTDKVSKNLNAMTTVLQKNSKHAQAIKDSTVQTASASEKAGSAAKKHREEIEKTSTSAKILANTIKGIAAYILTDMVVALGTLQSKGFAPAQAASLAWSDQLLRINLLLHGIPVSLTTIVGIQTQLADTLGGTHMFTQGIVSDISKFVGITRASAELTTTVASMIDRWSDGTEAVVKNAEDFAYSLSKASGVPINTIMADVANNAGIAARYGAAGLKSMMEQAVQLRRMGTDFQTMSNFGDKLVDDFQGTLAATAKIQTFLPGFNTAGIQFAAQFGTEADIAKELQASLRGSGIKDLSQLPRSLRNALSTSLGLDQKTLENLLHPISAKEKEAGEPITIKPFDTWMNKLQTALIDGFRIVAGLLTLMLGGNILKSIIEGKGTSGGIVAHLMDRGIGGLGVDAVKGIPATLKALPGNLKTVLFGRGAAGAVGEAGGLIPGYETAIESATAKTAGSSIFKLGSGLAKGLVGVVGGFVLDWGAKKLSASGHTGLAGTANIGSDALTGAGIGMLGGPIFAIAGAIVGGLIGLFKNGGAIWTAVKNFFSGKDVGSQLNSAAQSANIGSAFSAAGGHDLAFAQSALASQGSISSKTDMYTTPLVPSKVVVGDRIADANTSTATTADTTDMLSGKMDTLIHLMKNGGIAVNLDGRKVSEGLMSRNRYGVL